MNYKNIITAALISISLTACSKLDLQPLSKASTGTWFETAEQIEMSLNTLYLHQFWPMLKTDWGSTAIMALDEAADDWMNRTTLTIFTNGTLSSNNSTFVRNTWEYTYKAISRANTIINNMEKARSVVSEEQFNQYMADARFVRASMYSRLISRFGDVMYYENEPTLEEAYQMKRTDKLFILGKIYEDFDFAAQHLPQAYGNTQAKRATKGAALGMKARIAMFFHDYPVAEKAAKDCIDLNEYTLHPDFGELFLSSTKNAAEVIFGIPRSMENNSAIHPNGVRPYLSRNVAAPSTTAQPSWDLFLAFLCTDGKTVDQSPLYNPREPFKNRDPRLTYTIVEFNTNYFGFNYTPHPDSALCWNYERNQLVTNSDSKAGDQYASYNGLMLKKGIDRDWIDDFYANNDKIILRYADVLLIYAEARIEQNKIDASVLNYMNQVRARAYKTDASGSGYPVITETDQTRLRRLLRIERRMEFAFEGLRYDDIIRWRIAEVVMNRPNYGLPTSVANCRALVRDGLWFFGGTPQIDENGSPDFTTMPTISRYRVLSQRKFEANKHYLWPIPSTEQAVNPDLPNNPNY
jgi:hypothetical protein